DRVHRAQARRQDHVVLVVGALAALDCRDRHADRRCWRAAVRGACRSVRGGAPRGGRAHVPRDQAADPSMSSMGLTDEQIRRGLIAQGVPAEKASRALGSAFYGNRQPQKQEPTLATAPAGPVTLVLPWSCLISDNRHRGPVSSRADAAAYKLARTRAHVESAEQWGPRAPFSGRIALVARIFPPNAQRRDVGNFAK